jgi:hypothetical protein
MNRLVSLLVYCLLGSLMPLSSYALATGCTRAYAEETFAPAIGDAGPSSGSATAAPADRLHDPIANPTASFNDVKDAWSISWGAGLLAAIVTLTTGLARATSRWPNARLLRWFAKNKTAIFVVTGIGTVAAASFNALALGGTWLAALWAGIAAVLALIAPKHPATS